MPTLVLDDGRPLGESDAILMYLGEGTPYVPEDRYLRAQVLQWLFFEQYSHEPYIAVVRFWLDARRPRAARRRGRGTEGGRLGRARGRWSVTSRRAPSSSARRTPFADIALYAYTHVADEGGFDLGAVPGGARLAGTRRIPAGARPDHGLRSDGSGRARRQTVSLAVQTSPVGLVARAVIRSLPAPSVIRRSTLERAARRPGRAPAW